MKEFIAKLNSEDLRIAGVAMVLLCGYLTYWTASRSLTALGQRGHLREPMLQRLRNLLRLLLFSVTVLLAVQQSGLFQHAWALLSALVTTVSIGFFAIWSVLSNIVCSILILLFRPFRTGDWVEIVEAALPYPCGWVVDMNLIFVSLSSQDPSRPDNPSEPTTYVRIPNVMFFQKVVRCRGGRSAKISFYEI